MDTPSFDPRSDGIGHAIADHKPIIPIRQRSYSWTKDEVTELFNDLGDAVRKGKTDHFLGLIVVTQKTGSRPEVVDGQQRLATCVMLLAAIRDHFCESEPKTASRIQSDYLINYDIDINDDVPHLKLNYDDAPFFLDYVLREPTDPQRLEKRKIESNKRTWSKKPSHKCIREAANLARDRVAAIVDGLRPGEQASELKRWVAFIRDQARVIWFMVPDRSHAYTIFETLNDRGLDLSKSDLLKNYLFDCAGDRYEEVHQRWSKMLGAIEAVTSKDIAATYVRHFWISTHGPVRERQLFNQIKDEIQGVQPAIVLSTELERSASLYAAVLSSDHEKWAGFGAEMKENLSTLVILKAERIRPLLLAVARNFSDEEVKKAVRLFVNWTVRLTITGGVAGTIEVRFGELAKDVTDKKITTAHELSKNVNTKGVNTIPTDAEFEEAFAIARVAQHQLARYYLHELEDHYKRSLAGGDSPTRVNRREDVITLEHILPENPSSAWHFKNEDKQKEAMEYLTRIGNLTLMRKKLNNEAKSADFPTKRDNYYANEKSLHLTLALATEYADRIDWTYAEIAGRQKNLAKLAVATWPIKVL